MKFKLDENLGSSSAELLRIAGFDVVTVHNENLGGATDNHIFSVCIKENRCLITLDLDFSNILRFPPFGTPGIIILRPNQYSDISQIHALLHKLKRACEANDPQGTIWIVEKDKIRIHAGDND